VAAVTLGACGGNAPQQPAAGPAATAPSSASAPSAATATSPGSTVAGSAAGGQTTATDWVTYHHDGGRTGVDGSSPAIGSVTEAWRSPTLDGQVYAEPLVVGGQVIVATENDTVSSFDAASGAMTWTRHLGDPVDGSTLPCGNIDPSGITGTPVADPTTSTLWVVTFERPAHHVLYALNLADGTVRTSRPADPPGADPMVEQQRGALSLTGQDVDVPYGGLFGDCGDYHGWVVGFPTAGGDERSFQVPNDRQAGIWYPSGATVASDGSLYVATGNGQSTDAVDDANSVIHLSSALAQLDMFAPKEWSDMNDRDLDLGSVGPTLLPGGLVFQSDKQGIGYVLDAAHLGGVGGERSQGKVCNGAFGATAVDGSTVFLPCRDGLHAVAVTGSGSSGFTETWSAPERNAGAPIVAGGVVWNISDGHLRGFDESTGAGRVDVTIDKGATDFPTLAAAGGRLFVPAGTTLIAYEGS
jgi:hypothetical protein